MWIDVPDSSIPRIARAVAPALLVAVLAATPAHAQTSAWSTPALVPGSVSGTPQLALGADGSGLVAYSAGSAARRAPDAFAAALTPAGFDAATRVASNFDVTRIVGYSSSRLIAGGLVGSGGATPRPAVATATTEPARAWRVTPLVPSGSRGTLVGLAVNARGDASVLYTRCRGVRYCTTADLLVRLRRAGGTFGASHTIAANVNALGGAVAVDDRGRSVVAWEQPRRGLTGTRDLLVRRVSAGGGLGTRQRLARAVPSIRFEAAFTSDGRAGVAWLSQRVSEGDGGRGTIGVAVAARSARFAAARMTVERIPVAGTGRYVADPGVRLAPLASGGLLAAWTGYAGGHFVVRAAELDGTALRGAHVVSDPTQDTVLADVASGPQGQAIVLGTQGIAGADPSGPVSVVAAVRGPRAGLDAFGPPEAVSVAGPGFVDAPRVAIDPISGRAISVWRALNPAAIAFATRSAP